MYSPRLIIQETEEQKQDEQKQEEPTKQLNEVYSKIAHFSFFKQYHLKSKCKICLQDLRGKDLICPTIKCCSSIFHVTCLRAYVLDCFSTRKLPIKCPQAECKYKLTSIYLNQILTLEEMEKFWKKIRGTEAMRNPQIYTQCSTVDCDHIFQHLVTSGTRDELTCPKCSQITCRRCKLGGHAGLSCVEYNLLDAVDVDACKIFSKEKWRKCPNCNYFISKTEGCITCAVYALLNSAMFVERDGKLAIVELLIKVINS